MVNVWTRPHAKYGLIGPLVGVVVRLSDSICPVRLENIIISRAIDAAIGTV